ncbi:bifunctional Gfo/Idh/MocA family oxidoreductase/class I SAM-dependent methyltransferase [Sporomusa termitida]|uniref:Thiaz-red: thiazolinyl imide reductase n=1 Tax=Sporomusa termitida TaxID=2377 RepID=A0A517DRA7_9FIRM|nr:bifunctional Gfo/Idh/MocA family oxidoreductase/class I SAM-dependent methyltransferase [Sporomusa termitida]QDR79899.1 thiaz-red: thiazolinyl imide reductase [Sporomusa termitida]
MKKKLRTVVCGSTFGQFYLEALKLLPEEYDLVGLLAQGSRRSEKCAGYYGVNLYTEISQVPDDIDLACVVLRSGVMGGKGTDMSLKFLERGVHVMQEMPVHHKDMAACLKIAHQKKVLFQTGDLYVHLPAVKRFIACARAMLAQQNALYIDAAFASQVSYPLVHILMEALPTIRPWKTGTVSRGEGPFHVMTGTLGNIPVIVRVHNEVDPDDPDNYLHLLHRITLGSEGGSLTLTDTHGPVLWQPRLHIPENLHVLGDLATAEIDHMLENSTEILGTPFSANYRDILAKLWPRAIADNLSLMKDMIAGSINAVMRVQQDLLCARQWHEITSALGYPVLRSGCRHQLLPVQVLQEAVAKIADEGIKHTGEGSCFPVKTEVSACTEYADHEFGGINRDCVNVFVEKMKDAVFGVILYTLQAQGALVGKEREYSMTEIISASYVAPRHRPLIRRWLELLAEYGYLRSSADRIYGTDVVSQEMLKERWQTVRTLWDGKLGLPLSMDYLIRSAEQLPQLMSGEQQAVYLLFPEGKMDYASACYRDIMARYLNKSVAEAVIRIGTAAKLARPSNKEDIVRIIEVGAGTGATTEEIVPRIKEYRGNLKVDYLFTDVSNYFLTAARKNFRECPWMRFQTVDIDKDFWQQGLEPAGADIIIAAGVLDNAFDVDKTLAGLMRVLTPSGWLLVTEPVRDFPEMLISEAFMMVHPEDSRKTKTIFMSAAEWQEIFYNAGAAEVLVLPGVDHPLDPLGQKLFIVRKQNYA